MKTRGSRRFLLILGLAAGGIGVGGVVTATPSEAHTCVAVFVYHPVSTVVGDSSCVPAHADPTHLCHFRPVSDVAMVAVCAWVPIAPPLRD
jgi:hypothetical protein